MLGGINSPGDLRALPVESLPQLAEEIRGAIISTVAANGGHLASNLGVVEMTVALLRVFDPASDKILFDVSHQSYAYKLLTGRRGDFATLRKTGGLSGFQKRCESGFDAFGSGHAGTAISGGLGFAAERDARGGGESVVAVVGDASIANGVSLEALNNVASTTSRMIVVLNDNQMSISKNVGGLSHAFGRMLANRRYNEVKTAIEKFGINRLKLGWARSFYHRVESALKSLFTQGRNKPFENMGVRYIGPVYGHDIAGLANAFEAAKKSAIPVLIHIGTQKGRGFAPAEAAPEDWHATGPFDAATGARKCSAEGSSWSAEFGACLCEIARADGRVIATTAGMGSGTGLDGFQKEFPKRFYDVGICEEHQMTFAAGLAAAGLRPVVAVYSTFMQRAVDGIIHDIALQKLPVLICLDRAGVVPGDGATHHGVFDIALLRPVPGLAIMQPRDAFELRAMMRMAMELGAPAVIRYPRANAPQCTAGESASRAAAPFGKAEIIDASPLPSPAPQTPPRVAIWTLGPEKNFAQKLAALLAEGGAGSVHVDARFAKPIDRELLAEQAASGVKVFATVEDGAVCGGFGSAVEEFFSERGISARVVKTGWPDEFIPHASSKADLTAQFGVTPEAAAAKILAALSARAATF